MREIKFIDVGEGIIEGHIQKWLFKDGDKIKEDEPVVQIETDKAVVNLPSPVSGVLRINIQENTTVKVGATLAYVLDESEASSFAPPRETAAQQPKREAMQEQQNATSVPKAVLAPAEDIIATPSVRRMARNSNLDITKIRGTGPNGRITEGDVVAAAGKEGVHAHQQTESKTGHIDVVSKSLEVSHASEIERVPMSQTRKAIARNMEASWTIPRASHMELINATSLFRIVSKEKEKAKTQLGVHLTFMPFVIKATVEALKENPTFNASYDKDRQEIIVKMYYNIGLATETQDGLKVMVIKEADKKSIVQIAREIDALAEKFRNNTATLEDMRDSTFTITNIGSLGGGFLSVPMINYPEVAILGVHLIKDWAGVDEEMVKIQKILPVSVSFDHRVVDGAEAVHFTNSLKRYLEDAEFLEML